MTKILLHESHGWSEKSWNSHTLFIYFNIFLQIFIHFSRILRYFLSFNCCLLEREEDFLQRGPPCNPAGRPKRRRFGCVLPQNDVVYIQKCIAPKRRRFGANFWDTKRRRFGQNTPKTTSFWPPCRVAGRPAPQDPRVHKKPSSIYFL